MAKFVYATIDGFPHEPGFYFVDDDEYGELNVANVFFDESLEEWFFRLIGWEDEIGEGSANHVVFYGPIPLPVNTKFKLEE